MGKGTVRSAELRVAPVQIRCKGSGDDFYNGVMYRQDSQGVYLYRILPVQIDDDGGVFADAESLFVPWTAIANIKFCDDLQGHMFSLLVQCWAARQLAVKQQPRAL